MANRSGDPFSDVPNGAFPSDMNVAYGVPFDPPGSDERTQRYLEMVNAAENAPEHMRRPGSAGAGMVWAVDSTLSYVRIRAPGNCVLGDAQGSYFVVAESDPELAAAVRRCAPCAPGQTRMVRPDGSIYCVTPFLPAGCDCPTVEEGRRAGAGSVVWDTFPVWGTLLGLAVLVVPAVGYMLWKERREGKW